MHSLCYFHDQTFSLSVDLGNISDAALTNTELRLQLPADVVLGPISDGGMQDGGSGEIVWSEGSVAAGVALQREVEYTDLKVRYMKTRLAQRSATATKNIMAEYLAFINDNEGALSRGP